MVYFLLTFVATNIIIFLWLHNGGDKMTATKKGRPTDSIKDTMLRVRVDKETLCILDDCAKISNTSRSDIIRKGITLVAEQLKK